MVKNWKRKKKFILVLPTIFIFLFFISLVSAGLGYNMDEKRNVETKITTNINVYSNINLTNLSELDDTNIPSPSDGQALTWDSGTAKWIASTVSGIIDTVWDITGSKYLINNSNILDINETVLNATIDARTSGLTENASWNQSYADGLYADIKWAYNQTISGGDGTDNATWNETLANTLYIAQSEEGNLNTNSSDFWDVLDTYNSTQMLNSETLLSVNMTWFSDVFDNLFSAKTTDSLTEGTTNLYNNGTFNQTLTDTLYGGSGGNPFDQDLNTTSHPTFDNLTLNTLSRIGGIAIGRKKEVRNLIFEGFNIYTNTTDPQKREGLVGIENDNFIQVGMEMIENNSGNGGEHILFRTGNGVIRLYLDEFGNLNITEGNLSINKLINCDTIDTDSNGLLVCGTDETGTNTINGTRLTIENITNFDYNYNQSDGSYNVTYDIWAYNQTTVSGIQNGTSGWILNFTKIFSIDWSNLTSLTDSLYASIDWGYNQTQPAQDYADVINLSLDTKFNDFNYNMTDGFEPDTNETAFLGNLTQNDCPGGQFALGVQNNGTIFCGVDQQGTGNASWNESHADTIYIKQTNESNLNVNSSNFWNTSLGSLDNINTTQFENNGGILNLLPSWLTSFIDDWFTGQTTDSLTEGTTNLYNNGTFNQTLTDTLYGGSGDNATFNETLTNTLYTSIDFNYNETYTGGTFNSSYINRAGDNMDGNLNITQFISFGATFNITSNGSCIITKSPTVTDIQC